MYYGLDLLFSMEVIPIKKIRFYWYAYSIRDKTDKNWYEL